MSITAPDKRDKARITEIFQAQFRHSALLDSEEFIVNEANLRKALLDFSVAIRAEERERIYKVVATALDPTREPAGKVEG